MVSESFYAGEILDSGLRYEHFVAEMIAKHGRYEMLHRETVVSLNDTLFMEGMLVDEVDGAQYQAHTFIGDNLICLVPVVDVLWARAKLEGLYGAAQNDLVVADARLKESS